MTMQVAFYKGRTSWAFSGPVRDRLRTAKHAAYDRIAPWWLHGRYSHVELILGIDDQSMSICASSSIRDGGVRVKHMRLKSENWDVIDAPARCDVYDAWHWLAQHNDDPYDWRGSAGFVLPPLGHDEDKVNCGEAVAAMLGVPEPWRYHPCNLRPFLEWRIATYQAPRPKEAVA